MLDVAITGAAGRMGRMLIEAVLGTQDLRLAGACDLPGNPAVGRDAAEFLGRTSGVQVQDNVPFALMGAGYLIDFTRPQATLDALPVCIGRGVRMVIGTTGFDEAGREAIRRAAEKTAIVFAPNMSVGVNATFKLLEIAARMLGDGYDIEIIETHHRHKVDAPSGTALKMGEIVAGVLGRNLEEDGVFAREGVTGERRVGTIGFSAIRGGDVVGDHTVLFAGTGERIEITHRAASRVSYAVGALRACRFLAGHRTGLFDMHDVLGLR